MRTRSGRLLRNSNIADASKPSLRNIQTPRAQVILQIEDDFSQACGALLTVGFLNDSSYISYRHHWQGRGLILITNRLLQRIFPVHVAIACEQQHPAFLNKPPNRSVAACVRQACIYKRNQFKQT